MKDLIKVGDIVCYSSQNRCRLGRVTQVIDKHKKYVIVPIKEPKRVVKRNYDEIVSAARLVLAQENSKYAR